MEKNLDELKDRLHFTVSTPDSWYYKEDNAKKILMEHFHTTSLLGIGLEDYDSGMISAGALMQYLYDTPKKYNATYYKYSAIYDRLLYDCGYIDTPQFGTDRDT